MEQVLIYVGASQTCKSSSLKLLTGDESVVCGDERRRASTTYEIRIYREFRSKMSKSFLHIDTIGFGDNRLKYSSTDIRNKIQMEILRASQSLNISRIKAIIMTESLQDSTHQLTNNIKQVSNIFGFLPAKSIIVLGTKTNQVVHHEDLQDRENQIRQLIVQNCIPVDNYLRFLTPFKRLNESEIPPEQFSQLQRIISRCQFIDLQSIREKKQLIDSIAVRIQKEELRTVQIEVNQDRVEYRMQKQPYTVDVSREVWRGDIGKILGKNLGGKKTVWEKETKYRDVKVPYTVTEKVKKHITVQQDFQYCYRKALQQFEKSLINSLNH